MGVGEEMRRVIRESWREARDQNISFMAGSIAYHAFVSMLPLLLFLLAALSAVGSEPLTAQITDLTSLFLTPYAQHLLFDSLDAASALTGVSILGAATLLWGMSKIFRGLDVAFSQIYDADRPRSLLKQFESALVVFAALGVAVAAIAAGGAVASVVPDLPYSGAVSPLLLVAALAVAFFPVYYVFPGASVTPREVIPGVVFAAVGWAALEALFHTYVSVAGRYEAAYGTLGSVFLVLIWLYFGGVILLFGAVLNAVLAGRTGDEHALGVTDEESAAGPIEERPPTDDPGDAGRPADPPAVAHDGRGRGSRTDLELTAEPREAAPDRLRAEVDRLEAENERLRNRNEALARHIERHREDSMRERVRRRLFGE